MRSTGEPGVLAYAYVVLYQEYQVLTNRLIRVIRGPANML